MDRVRPVLPATLPADPRAIWATYTLFRRVLEAFAGRLGARGVDVLAVKGAVTSEWLYRATDERPLSDLDVRVRPRDVGTVRAACEDEGWRIDRYLRSYGTVVIDIGGVPVDVECRVGPPGVSALPVDALLARATRDPGGFWVPEKHDHAVLLTINVFKDKLSMAMPWAVEDLARVVDAPGVDATEYVARVEVARVTGLAWVVADWMARERDHATWRRIRGLLGGDAPRRRRYTSLARRLVQADDPFSLGMRVVARAASDDPRQWPRALALSFTGELELEWDRRRRARRS